MREYYRLMLGNNNGRAEDCFTGGYVGTDYQIDEDLTGRLPERWQDFNREFIPIYQKVRPDKSRVGAGLAMGALWTVSRGLQQGDLLLCPGVDGRYRVAEVSGPYVYAAGQPLQHRRPVRWLECIVDRHDMSESLRSSAQSRGTVVCLTKHASEIERLLNGVRSTSAIAGVMPSEEGVEDISAFAMEKHLEDFLVANWSVTEFGREFSIYAEDGEVVGQQYPTDTGPLDILAISKDKRRLLVVELKKGRASDVVVGQVLRYMSYVRDELAEPEQTVEGAIVALEDDQRIRRAISMVPTVAFYRYQISFKLVKA